MSECELCGKYTTTTPTIIEGTKMNVCEKCGRHGQKLQPPKNKSYTRTVTSGPELLLKENYAQLILQARQKQGIDQKSFAQQIREKESVVAHVESGKLRPSESLAKKFEKALRVRLFEPVESVEVEKREDRPLTMGDLLRTK